MKKNLGKLMTAVFTAIFAIILGGSLPAMAEDSAAVTIGETDYELLTMKIDRKENTILYYSTDAKKTWNEVEGIVDGNIVTMDISWASATANTYVYFKGNKNSNVVKVELPKQLSTFKVKFDKVNSNFDMTGYEDQTVFYWRKSTDYNWQTVPLDVESDDYKRFLKQVSTLRIKGAKLFFKLGQEKGTGINDMGSRPSKEIAVTISKLNTAPSVKVNITKLTLNTKTTMEYCDNAAGNDWTECQKNMLLEDIAPAVFFDGGAKTVSLKFRTAATSTKAASLETLLTIKGQEKAPTIGDNSADVLTYYEKDKLVLSFKKASKDTPFEYCIIKPDKDFDLSRGWKSVTKAKDIKLSTKTAPSGSEIYVRYKGMNANTSKKIEMKLPSDYALYVVG